MKDATLQLGPWTVARFGGGFADPGPLLLFERRELVGTALETTCGRARSRLAAFDVASRLVVRALTTLQAAGIDVLTSPSRGWADLSGSALLSYHFTRTPVGFRPVYDHVDVRAVARLCETDEPSAGMGLLLCCWTLLLDELEDSSSVRYDLGDALESARVQEDFAALWDLLPPEVEVRRVLSALEAGLVASAVTEVPAAAWEDEERVSTVLGLSRALSCREGGGRKAQARAEALDLGALKSAATAFERTLCPDDVVNLLSAARTAADCDALAGLVGRALIANQGDDGELWARALDWAVQAAQRGAPQAARQALEALATRAPAAFVAEWKRCAHVLDDPDHVASWLIAGLTLASTAPWRAEAHAWRLEASGLAGSLLEQGGVLVALSVLRAAADVDRPSPALADALRLRLRALYGLRLEIEPARLSSRYLVALPRPAEADDVVDLSRLLFDGILGAVVEAHLEDDTAREALFSARIATALSYLEADPSVDGGRIGLARPRTMSGGPGLGAVVLFLLVLAAVIAVVGLALRYA